MTAEDGILLLFSRKLESVIFIIKYTSSRITLKLKIIINCPEV